SAGGSGTDRRLPQSARRIPRVRPGRKHREGQGAGPEGCLRDVSRRGVEGHWSGARTRRPVAELHGTPDVRHAGRRAQGSVVGPDEGDGYEYVGSGSVEYRGVCGVVEAVKKKTEVRSPKFEWAAARPGAVAVAHCPGIGLRSRRPV